MSTEKDLARRVAKAVSMARAKKIAELENDLREAAKKKAPLKKPKKAPSKGEKKAPKSRADSAANKFKKPQPKAKGKKEEVKLKDPSNAGGYPYAGDQKGGLGSGKPKSPKTRKTVKKELSDAEKKRKELTSEIPKLKSTPKAKPRLPTLEDKRLQRKKKIAELKLALKGQAPDSEMDTTELQSSDLQDVTGKATKEQRVPAAQVLRMSQELLPKLSQGLTQANDMLEDAIMGSNLQKIKGALAFLLTKMQELTKQGIIPMGAQIRQLMMKMPKTASVRQRKTVKASVEAFDSLEQENARSLNLMMMATKKITRNK